MKQSIARRSKSRRSPGRRATFEEAVLTLPESFYESLLAQLPTASRMEINICALTCLNYSSREIGRMLSIAASTVDNHRYRIRKKLGLVSSDTLNKTLMQLSGSNARPSAELNRIFSNCTVTFTAESTIVTFRELPFELSKILAMRATEDRTCDRDASRLTKTDTLLNQWTNPS